MVERKVAFNIDMSPGVSQLRQQMNSVVQLSKSTMLQIQQAEERHQARLKELKKKQMEIEKAAFSSNVEAHRRAIRAIEAEEDRHALRMKQMNERAVMAQQSKGAGVSGKMGSIGASLVARGVSSALPNFMGSAVSGGVEAGIGASLMGATAAAATGIGLLAGAAILAGTAISGLKDVAQSVVGAVAQIGGVRGLQEMLVEGSNTERMAANISANVTEKLGTSEVFARINTLSGNSEFGPDKIGQMFENYVAKTGKMSPLSNLGSFATDFSSVAKMTPGETGTLFGQLTAQFGLVGDQLKQTALMLWQSGRAGTVELRDTSAVAEALGFARKAGGGNLMQGIATEMGAIQLTHAGLGGKNPDEAVTALKRFQEELENPKKQGAIQAALGTGSIMKTGPDGLPVYRNFKNVLARSALYELEHPGGLKGLGFEERGTRVPRGIGEYTSQTPEFKAATTHAGRLKVLEDTIEKFSDSKVVIDEFDGALKKVQDTVDYQFKQAINNVTIQLEGAFLPVLKEMVPVIKSFADQIIAHKDEIGDMFRKFVVGLIMAAEALPILVNAVYGVAKWLASMVPDAGEKVTDAEKTLAGQKANLASMESDPTYQGPNAKWVLDAQRGSIKDTENSLSMWRGIKQIQDMNVADMKARADNQYSILTTKHGASDSWDDSTSVNRPETKHEAETKTLAQKQLQVLEAIKANTMPPAPKVPPRTTDGQ